MRTINEQEFIQFCREVRQEAPRLLQGATNGADRTSPLLRALFERVCARLGLDWEKQKAELGDGYGFALLQTLEEHMQPEFSYTPILDRDLLADV